MFLIKTGSGEYYVARRRKKTDPAKTQFLIPAEMISMSFVCTKGVPELHGKKVRFKVEIIE